MRLQHLLSNCLMVVRRPGNWTVAVGINRIDVRTSSNQIRDQVRPSCTGSQMRCGIPFPVCCICVNSVFQETLHKSAIAIHTGRAHK